MQNDHTRSKRTVMIVDDEGAVRQLLRTVLEACGYRVVAEACDGVQAVARYREVRPGITLMDICMPNMNGLDATREIIAFDAHARIVLLSGIHRSDLAHSARQAGARFALGKPLRLFELKEVLASIS